VGGVAVSFIWVWSQDDIAGSIDADDEGDAGDGELRRRALLVSWSLKKDLKSAIVVPNVACLNSLATVWFG
jgi:hypothetical protein